MVIVGIERVAFNEIFFYADLGAKVTSIYSCIVSELKITF